MIQQTEKKCKGSGKAIGYGCGELQLVRVYGLGRNCGCYSHWLFNTEQGQEKIRRSIIKAKKEVKHKGKVEFNKIKNEVTNWKKKLQTKVQEIARLIDKGLLCIARQIVAKQMHGGHVIAKGGNSQMRFNLHNIHRQSSYSNTYCSDDALMQEGVVREYGKEYLEFILSLKKYDVPKFSNNEYHEKYKLACKIANALKKENRTFDAEERIELRNRFNFEIDVYSWEQCNFS